MKTSLLAALALVSTTLIGCDHPAFSFGPWTIASIATTGQPLPGGCMMGLPGCYYALPVSPGAPGEPVDGTTQPDPVEGDAPAEPEELLVVEVRGMVEPDLIEFGAVPIGLRSGVTVLVANEGRFDLEGRARLSDGEVGFSLEGADFGLLRPGDTVEIEVLFAPEFDDEAIDALTIETDIQTAVIDLVGSGTRQ